MKMKTIPGFPNYSITKGGDVWSHRRKKWLKPISRNLRLSVCLCFNAQKYPKLIHRLVLETYVGPCPKGKECRHLDGNSLNNNLDNLRWGTHKENGADMVRHGRANRESSKGNAKLTEKEVKNIRRMLKIGIIRPQYKIAQYYNVSPQAISHIKMQKNWKNI